MSDNASSPGTLRELLTEASDGPVHGDFNELYEHARRRRRTRRAASVAAVVLAVAVVAPAVAVGAHIAQNRSAHAGPGWAVTYPIHLPGDYVEPTGSAADPDTAGVWYFAQGGTPAAPKETVFHWVRATGRTASYQISPIVPVGNLTPLAVGPSGVAWLGLNSTLLEINPASASPVTRRSLPEVGAGHASEGLPGDPPGSIPAIESLAVNATGQVVVGRSFATALQLVDPTTGHVSTIPFPRNHVLDPGLGNVSAGAGDTAVAAIVGRQSTRQLVELVHGGWHELDIPCPAFGTSATAQTLVLRGEHCLVVRTGPPGSPMLSAPIAPGRPITCAQALTPDLLLVCAGRGGAYLDNIRSGVTSPVDLGSVTISNVGSHHMPLAHTPRQPTTSPTKIRVAVVPIRVTSGGAGAAFFIPVPGPNEIGLLTTASSAG